MRNITIQFQDFPDRYWESVQEHAPDTTSLISRLEEIRRAFLPRVDHPIGVNLLDESGNSMSIGLGANSWLLIFTRVDQNAVPLDQLHSVGEHDGGSTVRFCFSETDEFPGSYLVPRALAEAVVREWATAGTLSNQIRWAYEGE